VPIVNIGLPARGDPGLLCWGGPSARRREAPVPRVGPRVVTDDRQHQHYQQGGAWVQVAVRGRPVRTGAAFGRRRMAAGLHWWASSKNEGNLRAPVCADPVDLQGRLGSAALDLRALGRKQEVP
jgi:hypothetical protein